MGSTATSSRSVLVRTVHSARRILEAEGVLGLLQVAAKNPPVAWCRPSWWRRRLQDDHFLGRVIECTGNRVRVEGCRFSVAHPAIPTARKGLFFRDRYEIEERHALAQHLDPELPAVEFGGSIGVVACLTNRRLRDPERHVVVEGNPEILPLLEHNRRRNRARFTVVHGAIAYGASAVDFHCGDFLDSGLHRAGGTTVRVPTITLADVVRRTGFERFTLICDIEGQELDLVARECELLQARVATLILEAHPTLTGEAAARAMFARLAAAGFEAVFREQETWVLQNRHLTNGASQARLGQGPVRPGPAAPRVGNTAS